jgi:uncharacterized protein (DUF2235 family)
MARRLALCFDGTWNSVKDHTNVSRIHAAIRNIPDGDRGEPQLKYYDEGVGTRWYDRLHGGAGGWGLSKNIRQGYAWLIEHYRDKNEIFLFGFSRGAYTARSLAGLIGRCGVPQPPTRVGQRSIAEIAKEAYDIYRASPKADEKSKRFVREQSRAARVRFIGVWDTVGALGVPVLNVQFAKKFHDTELGAHVDHAYHALAIDEHRKDYSAALWTGNRGDAHMEQRWFPGAHANVGGGYPDDLLPDLALAWIAERARACGLDIPRDALRIDGSEYRSPIVDAFKDFAFGVYRYLKLGQRYRRPIGQTLNETVDASAYQKWAAEPDYRPENLAHADASVAAPGTG